MTHTQKTLGQVYHSLMLSGFFDRNPRHRIASELSMVHVLIDGGISSLRVKVHGDGSVGFSARHLKLHVFYRRPPMSFDPFVAPTVVKDFLKGYYQACIEQQSSTSIAI